MYDIRPTSEFAPNDVVVDSRNVERVSTILQELGAGPPGRVEQNEALDLTLLGDLLNVAAVAAAQRSIFGETISQLEEEHGTPSTFSDLDVLLLAVHRRHISRVPLFIGKNRHMAMVVSISGGCPGRHCPVGHPLVMTNPGPAYVRSDRPGAGDPDAGDGVTVGLLDGRPATPGSVVLPWEIHGDLVESIVRRLAQRAQVKRIDVPRGDTGRVSGWSVATAIAGFAGSGLDVLCLALACRTLDDKPPLLIRRAMAAVGPDVLVLAAAGDHGCTELAGQRLWPSALDAVVSVGATDAPFTPAGVDHTAQGVDVTGDFPDRPVLLPTRLPELAVPGEKDGVLATEDERRRSHEVTDKLELNGQAMWSGTSLAVAVLAGQVAAAMTGGVTARDALAAAADPAPAKAKAGRR